MSNSLIGPRLLADIKRTISIVRGDSGGDRIIPNPTRFEGGGGTPIKVVTFTGSWSIGSPKTVTFDGSTNTASAVNLFHNIGVDCGSRKAAIAKNGTAWILLVPQCG